MDRLRAGTILFVIAMLAPHPGATAEVSFDLALKQLHTANETLQAARTEESQRESERSAARGLYFPRIDTSARFTRIDEPITITIPQLGTIPVQDDQFWRANVSFKWPLFTGGRILAANRAAEAYLEESQEKRRRAESGLISELARRYYGLRLAQQVIEVRREVLSGMEHHLSDARKMEEQGVVARSERLHAEVKANLHETELYAPVDGQIVDLLCDPGEMVSPGFPTISIVDLRDAWLTFNVREDLLAHIRMGDVITARITALGNREIKAKVTYISALGDFATCWATKTSGDADLC